MVEPISHQEHARASRRDLARVPNLSTLATSGTVNGGVDALWVSKIFPIEITLEDAYKFKNALYLQVLEEESQMQTQGTVTGSQEGNLWQGPALSQGCIWSPGVPSLFVGMLKHQANINF